MKIRPSRQVFHRPLVDNTITIPYPIIMSSAKTTTVVFALVAIFVVATGLIVAFFLLIKPVQIYGNSMEPNYLDGDRYLTLKAFDSIIGPGRGTVIVYTSPDNRSVQYISRVIGLPGDEIKIEDGAVYIDGVAQNEDYIAPNARTDTGSSQILVEGETTSLPEGKYIVLSDNRMHAIDSRQLGYITKADIVGRVFLKY